MKSWRLIRDYQPETHGRVCRPYARRLPPNAADHPPDNLSIYWQEDTRRRSVIDNPKRPIENFEIRRRSLGLRGLRCAALVENIQIGDFQRQPAAGRSGITHEPESRTAASPARSAEQAARQGGNVCHATGMT